MGGSDHTLTTNLDAAKVPGRERTAPMLFLVVEYDRPAAGGARWCLRGVDSVAIGRGDARGALREDSYLRIDLPDRHMSREHARLERALGRWVVVDAGSKNGVVLNGERVDRAGLSDGDLFEVGRCVFAYRSAQPIAADAEPLEAAVPVGFHTALPGLEVELSRVADVARSNVPVMIGGESGTGKELMARAIHDLSERPGRFVAVNCGALPQSLVESELFGHTRGAFSGAAEERAGFVRSAHDGTLLLDEVGDLPMASQAAFLRFLQEGEVVPVGSEQAIAVDVRVVCATHRDLPAMARRGEFREDLLARLSGYRISLPPLHERVEDLGTLIASVLGHSGGPGADQLALSRDAARLLVAYDWPLNVRELEQALAAARAIARDGIIEPAHLPDAVRAGPKQPLGSAHTLGLSEEDAARREQLERLLTEHRGNVSAVARDMGKARIQIHRWLKRYRIDLEHFR